MLLHGTKCMTTSYDLGCSEVEGQRWEVRKCCWPLMEQNLLTASAELNSSRIVFFSVKHSAWMTVIKLGVMYD